jgi:hypothetical protein
VTVNVSGSASNAGQIAISSLAAGGLRVRGRGRPGSRQASREAGARGGAGKFPGRVPNPPRRVCPRPAGPGARAAGRTGPP